MLHHKVHFLKLTNKKIGSKKLKIDFCVEITACLHLLTGNLGSVLFPARIPLLWRNWKNVKFHCQICSFCGFFFVLKMQIEYLWKGIKQPKSTFWCEDCWGSRPPTQKVIWIPHLPYPCFPWQQDFWTFFDAPKLSRVGFLIHHSTFCPLYSLYNCKLPLQSPARVMSLMENWWFFSKSI